MKRSPLVKTLSCLFCAVYFVALPTAQALVLCIDEHAHGEVQSAYDNCCVSSQAEENVSGSPIESFREVRGAQCDSCENIGMSKVLTADVGNTDVAFNILPQTTPTSSYYASILPKRKCTHVWPPTKISLSHFPDFLRNTILLL